jgi:L-alanine-DL-glutamate epimerase-like enolase superfamily enzyme
MKIARMTIHSVALPFRLGRYTFSGEREMDGADSTVICLETDCGLRGYGEVCPAGASYIPQNPEAARACLALLGPKVVGRDPREIGAVNAAMSKAVSGHDYAKAPIDMACWDLLGQATGQPVHRLLGGRRADSVPAHRAIAFGPPEEAVAALEAHRARGFRHFQLKAGCGVKADIARISVVADALGEDEVLCVDANGAWTFHEAMLILRGTGERDFILEEPCARYETNRSVRLHTNLPMKLDESIDDLRSLLKAQEDQTADIVSIKLSKFGGLTGARLVRDLCERLGMVMNIECVFGSEITSSAVAHLAISTAPRHLLNASHYGDYFDASLGEGSARVEGGRIVVDDRPGLGLRIDEAALGPPLMSFGAEARPRRAASGRGAAVGEEA